MRIDEAEGLRQLVEEEGKKLCELGVLDPQATFFLSGCPSILLVAPVGEHIILNRVAMQIAVEKDRPVVLDKRANQLLEVEHSRMPIRTRVLVPSVEIVSC